MRILISDPDRRWREGVVARLNELCQLEQGWDGYQGRAVAFENANFALSMLDACCGANVPAPQIVPGPSGDLQLEWHLPHGDIELHITSPYVVNAWHRTAQTQADGEEVELTNDFTAVARWMLDLTEPMSAAEAAAA